MASDDVPLNIIRTEGEFPKSKSDLPATVTVTIADRHQGTRIVAVRLASIVRQTPLVTNFEGTAPDPPGGPTGLVLSWSHDTRQGVLSFVR